MNLNPTGAADPSPWMGDLKQVQLMALIKDLHLSLLSIVGQISLLASDLQHSPPALSLSLSLQVLCAGSTR